MAESTIKIYSLDSSLNSLRSMILFKIMKGAFLTN